MSFILSAYTENAFQEFFLPEIDNSNYSITLDSSVFSLINDITVSLEVVNGEWRFMGISGGSLLYEKCVQPGEILKQGGVIRLEQDEAWIAIVVMPFEGRLDSLPKYKLKLPCRITIGQAADNDIRYEFNSMVSQRHAVMEIDENGCTISDTSTNGVFMGYKRITGQQHLSFGDSINILGLQIVWLGNMLAIGGLGSSASVKSSKLEPYDPPEKSGGRAENTVSERRFFRRSPRNFPQLYSETIEIEGPPQPSRSARRPLILTIGPSLTMAVPMALGAGIAIYSTKASGGSAGIYMFTGIIIAAASAIIGTAWALFNLRYSKKQEIEAENTRTERYREYLDKKKKEIEEKYQQNANTMHKIYPSASDCIAYSDGSPLLWNRNRTHPDYLFARLGLGDVPFQCPISIPKKKFTLFDDSLADMPQEIVDSFSTLTDVPVGIDLLTNRLVGAVGNAADIVRTIAVQTAANNCYTDVKMVFLYDGRTKRSADFWAFARWLPHTWSEDKSTRFVAADQAELGEVCFALTNTFRTRAERLTDASQETELSPRYIIFIEKFELIEGEPIAKYILDLETDYGLSSVIIADCYEQLPNSCTYIIQDDDDFHGAFSIMDREDEHRGIVFDKVSTEEAESFARRLAGIDVSETESGGEIPDSLTFLDMYNAKKLADLNVLDRWRKSRTYDSMKVPIGKKAGGGNWHLDIHEKYHGPHGLIAGTTGSGKSETLQTYILSLAVNYSPADIGFFIIDFKGGGMANLFSGLPHMVGQISNLSGNQIRRAMVSIKSENRRRQQLFGEYGVNHIDDYTKLYKNKEVPLPIPHLFIIIDEFAELKREEPEFMRELISVAQVGRSLGVHLILSTQKPSGTVDDNIWSNAKFRLCLRVQDRQDSNDMLHRPDAAYITQAGRGYMQVGNNEINELFQSGWSGASYDDGAEDTGTEIACMKTNTGSSAIIGNHFKMKRKERLHQIWINELGDCVGQALAALTETFNPENSALMEKVLDSIYLEFEKRSIDYQKSRVNSTKLANFALAYTLCPDGGCKERAAKAASMMVSKGIQLPEVKGKTQLTALVDYLGKLASDNGYGQSFRLWMPVLPEQLYLEDLFGWGDGSFRGGEWPKQGRDWRLEAVVGLVDNPSNQAQFPLKISLSENGHLAVCGSVVSGKSTFLQTMLYSLVSGYSPEYLNIYILDFSSRALGCFDGLAHVGGVMYEEDTDRTAKFFSMMKSILSERKLLMKGGNYVQYVRVNGPEVPAIVIAIDGFANFKEKTDNHYEDELISLSREGANYGIFLIVTSGGFSASEIQTRIADNLKQTVCLEMGDKFKYGDILRTLHFDVLPETGVHGRGLTNVGGTILEFQTALAIPADNDYERGEKIKRSFTAMNEAWSGKHARLVPSIPEKPVWSEFAELDAVRALASVPRYLPYAYNVSDASICSVDLSETYCWLIAGRVKTGKTNVLKLFTLSALMKRSSVCIMDFDHNQLKTFAEEAGAEYVDTPEKLYGYLKELLPEFKRRNEKKQKLIAAGLDNGDVFEEMSKEPPIFIMTDNIKDFINAAYNPPEGVGSMSGFLENIIEKGSLHNIYFFVCVNTEDVPFIFGKRAFDKMVSYRNGVYLGGNVAAQKIFDFTSLPYLEQSKPMKLGLGLLPSNENTQEVRKVVIPNARG